MTFDLYRCIASFCRLPDKGSLVGRHYGVLRTMRAAAKTSQENGRFDRALRPEGLSMGAAR
jgi:hypothetical protein